MLQFDDFKTYTENPGINASFLKQLRKSPLSAFTDIKKASKALNFGRAYHEFILERETFAERYYQINESERPEPGKMITSKANKEWKAAIVEENKGKELISLEDYNRLVNMQDVLLRCSAPAMGLVQACQREASLYAKIDVFGMDQLIDVKGRFDAIHVEKGVIIDLKTTKDASPNGFAKEAGLYAYHVQAAFYLMLAEKVYQKPFQFYFLTQETTAPYNTLLREVSPEMRAKGDFELKQLIPAAVHFKNTNYKPSYNVFADNNVGIIPLDIPDYFVQNHKFNI